MSQQKTYSSSSEKKTTSEEETDTPCTISTTTAGNYRDSQQVLDKNKFVLKSSLTGYYLSNIYYPDLLDWHSPYLPTKVDVHVILDFICVIYLLFSEASDSEFEVDISVPKPPSFGSSTKVHTQ